MSRRFNYERQLIRKYGKSSLSDSEIIFLRSSIIRSAKVEKKSLSIVPQGFHKLFFFPSGISQEISWREILNLDITILRTRGLVRWLSLNYLSIYIPKLQNSYQISRFMLMLILARNFRQVNELIGRHIRKISEINFDYGDIYYRQNDYFKAISGVRDDLKNVCRLETCNDLKLIDSPTSTEHSLIDFLIRENPTLFLQFLLDTNLNGLVFRILRRNYPDAATFLRERTKLQVKVLPNYESSFDDLLRSDCRTAPTQELFNIEIWHQRFLIQEGSLLEFDSTCSHTLPFVAGHWQYVMPSKLNMNELIMLRPSGETKLIDEAIYLCGRADENWYHFLMDTFPRLLFLNGLAREIPVLIREDLPQTTLEFVQKVIPRNVRFISHDTIIKVKKLHIVSARSTVFDSVNSSSIQQVNFSPKTISATSAFIKNSIKVDVDSKARSKLFINRSSRQRRFINEKFITKKVLAANFKVILDNEDLYREQVKLFSDSHVVISAGGAVLANMIFMPPGAKILCVRSNRDKELTLWRELASACQISYNEVRGLPTYFGKDRLKRSHSNFFVVPFKFYSALKSTMQSTTKLT